MRKVFLDDLLKRGTKQIDWIKSADLRNKIRFIYDDVEDKIEIMKYDCKEQYLYVKYKDKDIFKIRRDDFKKCKLGKLLGKYTNEFKIEIGTIFKDNKRDIIILKREYRDNPHRKGGKIKWYNYKCNKCFYVGDIRETDLVQGYGCPVCCTQPQKMVLGINTIWDTDKWMIPYVGEEIAKTHTRSSNKKIYAVCPDCGRIKTKKTIINNIYKCHSIKCSCSDGQSYPFKLMFNVLEQLGIDFETEYSPDWISPKRYDFHLQKYNIIIEMDGSIGHGKKNHSKSKLTAEESKEIDDYKDRLADEHNIEVIRIDCEKSKLEYIVNNILNSNLNSLFDLSDIDWNKAEKFALSNLCKKACEIKSENLDMTTTEIGKIIRVSSTTVASYLKKGNKLGWSNYDAEKEIRKNALKTGKLNGKSVKIFKDGISLGVFDSCHELERRSEDLFGVKLLINGIAMASRHGTKIYKGFTFRYIDIK